VAKNLALSLAESADADKRRRAVDVAETVARQDSQNGDTLAILAWCYFKNNKLPEAEQAMAVATSPKLGGRLSLDSAYYLAKILAAKSKIEDAHKILKAAKDEKGPFVYRAEARGLFDELDKKVPPKDDKKTK